MDLVSKRVSKINFFLREILREMGALVFSGGGDGGGRWRDGWGWRGGWGCGVD